MTLIFSFYYILFFLIGLSFGQLIILSDFTNDAFPTTLDPRYQIYDGSGNQLNISAFSVVNRCGNKDVIGYMDQTTGVFQFGLSPTNAFQNFTITNLVVPYPIYSCQVHMTLIYFGSTGLKITGFLKYGQLIPMKINLMNTITDTNLQCNTTQTIYYAMGLISTQGIPTNASFSIDIYPNTMSGSFGLRNITIAVTNCSSICKTCLNTLTCTTCPPNATLMAGNCNCPTVGFYWTYCMPPCQKQCLACPSTCATCNYTGCITCQTGLLFTTSQKCVSSCPDGTYQSGSNCLNCTGLCQTCSGSATYCLTCVQGYYEAAGGCTDKCAISEYVSNGHCLTCSSVCNTCENSNAQCTSCPGTEVLLGSNCISSCPSNTYKDLYSTCQNCDSNCGNCSHISTNCTSCNSILPLLFDGTCVSLCPSLHYYSNGSSCLACYNSCETCSGPLSMNCLTCSSSLYLYQNQCQSSCPSGTLIFQGGCVTGCQGGFYSDGSQCLACDHTCATCNGGSSSNCLSCAYPLSLSQNKCLPICSNGFYLNPQTLNCSICDITCKQCQNQSNLCLSCNNNYYLYSSSCLSSCPSQTYGDSASQTCKNCDNNCLTCSGPRYSDCFTCANNSFLSQGTCLNICPNGTFQYEPSKTCIICDSSCLTCSGTETNECLSCSKANYVLNQGTCTQSCPDNKYYNPAKSNLCQTCVYNCAKCASLTSCMLCENNYYLTLDKMCNRTKSLNFTVNQSDNPSSFQIFFTSYWDYIRVNFKDILSLSINPPGDISISSFSILNSSTTNVTFLVSLKYSKSFIANKFSLIFNLTIDYSKTNNEYYLIKTNQTIDLKNYNLCSDNQFYDTNLMKCVQKPQISPSLSYTTDSTRIGLEFSYSFSQLVANISIYSQVAIERFSSSDFTYKIIPISSGSTTNFIIAISTNKSIVAGPKLTYTLVVPNDIIAAQNLLIPSNSAGIALFDYTPLSEDQKKALDSAKSQTKTTSVIATGAAVANSAVASGTPMLLQGLMLTELIYLIKYIEIRYPLNVLQIFNSSSSLPTFFFFYSFQEAEEDKQALPPIFTYYQVKPFFLENNGELICKNMAILAIVYLSVQLVENNKSTSLIIRLLKFVHSLFIWELVLFFFLLYWQKFVFYTFSNVTFSSSTQNGIMNFSIACVFIFIECLFLLHIYLILNVITNIKFRMALLKFSKSSNMPFIQVVDSHSQIDSGKDSLSTRQKEENYKSAEKNYFSIEKKSFESNMEIEKSPNESPLKRPYKDTKLIVYRDSGDSSFTDSIRTDSGDKKPSSSLFSPTFSPSKFKKTTIAPNFDDSDLHSAGVKLDGEKKKSFVHQWNRFKYWVLNWRIVRYFYFPQNDEVFLRQYEFMHDDLKSENLWQTHYVWFDYLRQTFLSILAVVFHFQPFPQIFLINLVNIAYIVFYICLNPYKSKIIFLCCLVSELITESALISSLGLAVLDLNQQVEAEKRLLFGWIIVSANLALLYWLCFAGIIKILLMIYEKRKRKKILNEAQQDKK